MPGYQTKTSTLFLYYALISNPTIPTTINIGNATDISPPTTIPMRITGSKTTVKRNLEIPQAALIPNINSFPKTAKKQIINNNVNIFFFLSILPNNASDALSDFLLTSNFSSASGVYEFSHCCIAMLTL